MFSSLTREQKQRREALRDAQVILWKNGGDPEADAILSMAMFILNDEIHPKLKWYEADGRQL